MQSISDRRKIEPDLERDSRASIWPETEAPTSQSKYSNLIKKNQIRRTIYIYALRSATTKYDYLVW